MRRGILVLIIFLLFSSGCINDNNKQKTTKTLDLSSGEDKIKDTTTSTIETTEESTKITTVTETTAAQVTSTIESSDLTVTTESQETTAPTPTTTITADTTLTTTSPSASTTTENTDLPQTPDPNPAPELYILGDISEGYKACSTDDDCESFCGYLFQQGGRMFGAGECVNVIYDFYHEPELENAPLCEQEEDHIPCYSCSCIDNLCYSRKEKDYC